MDKLGQDIAPPLKVVDTIFVVLDFVLAAIIIVHALLVLFVAGGCTLRYSKSNFNALWISRYTIILATFVWDLGILLGLEGVWKTIATIPLSSKTTLVVTAFSWCCRVNIVIVLGVGMSTVCGTTLFIIMHNFSSKLVDPEKGQNKAVVERDSSERLLPAVGTASQRGSAQSVELNSQSLSSGPTVAWWKLSFAVPILGPNVKILWKSIALAAFMTVFYIATAVIDFLFANFHPQFLFSSYHQDTGQCTLAVLPASLCVILLVTFIAIYSIFSARLYKRLHNRYLQKNLVQLQIWVSVLAVCTMLARILQVTMGVLGYYGLIYPRYVDHGFKLLAYLLDAAFTSSIVIGYIVRPLREIIEVEKWKKQREITFSKVHETPSMRKEKTTAAPAAQMKNYNTATTPLSAVATTNTNSSTQSLLENSNKGKSLQTLVPPLDTSSLQSWAD